MTGALNASVASILPLAGEGDGAIAGADCPVAWDGGVFSFHSPFLGIVGSQVGRDCYYAIAVTDGGAGYLMATQQLFL